MDWSSRPAFAGLIALAVGAIILMGVVAYRSFSPPALEYPKGAGPGGPAAVAGPRPAAGGPGQRQAFGPGGPRARPGPGPGGVPRYGPGGTHPGAYPGAPAGR
jgi:hypothetical protein